MDKITRFNYNGFDITFNQGREVLINATEMAKPFGKTPKDWIRTNQSQNFINSLSSVRQICPSLLVQVYKGKSSDFQQGTWMHEDVALEFARWLSPRFAIWCNDRIKELLKYGITGSKEAIMDIIANPSNAIAILEALQKEREQNDVLHHKAKIQAAELKKQAPKVEYVDNVLLSNNTYTFTQMAKELNMTSALALSNILKENGVIFRQSGQWMLKAKYSGKGLTKTRTHTYRESNGRRGTSSITVWTEKGRAFLHRILN